MSASIEKKLDQLLDALSGRTPSAPVSAAAASDAPTAFDEEALYQRFKKRLVDEAPSLLRVLTKGRELQIEEIREVLTVDSSTLRGRVALLVSKGFFDDITSANSAFNELQRTGFRCAKPNVYRECDNLTELGFLTKETGGYRVVEDMKINVVQK